MIPGLASVEIVGGVVKMQWAAGGRLPDVDVYASAAVMVRLERSQVLELSSQLETLAQQLPGEARA